MSHSNLVHWHERPKCERCKENNAMYYVVVFVIHTDCNTGDPMWCEDQSGLSPEDVVDKGEHWLPREMPRACMDWEGLHACLCESCHDEFVTKM